MQKNQKVIFKDQIDALKIRQQAEYIALTYQYHSTIESLKPINLIKTATQEFVSSTDL